MGMTGAGYGQMMQGTGTIMQGIGQYQGAKAKQQQAKFAAKQMRRNADAMREQAGDAARMEKEKGDRVKGQAIAAMAASGGGIDTERLAAIQEKTDYNQLAALYEGAVASNTERKRAAATLGGAAHDMAAGKSAVLSSMLSGGGQMYEGFSKWQKQKALLKADRQKTRERNFWEEVDSDLTGY